MRLVQSSVLVVTLCAGGVSSVRAADVTWDNGDGNFRWDTTSLNWGGAAWNNAAGDGAVFSGAGVGMIDVMGPIFVDSLNFAATGYTLNGPGSLNIAAGSSTQTTGVVNVAAGGIAKVNVPINSSLGFQKIGAGELELSAPSTFGGGVPLTSNGRLRADLLIGGVTGPIASGTLRVMNSGVLPASTRVSIGNGFLDIGSNNVTIAELMFPNVTPSGPWNPVLNANNGVIGSGTLRVTGEINVIGVAGGNNGNSIAANLDLGGGTQVVRCGLVSSIGLQTALMFNGSLSNGSLLKTIGFTTAGVQGSIDGISLNGNNTYTGATILNSGTSIASGTNMSTSVKIAGVPAGPAGGSFSLVGANGSFLNASLIQAQAGGTFILDNNLSLGGSGLIQPNIPAAQNNNRIRDDALVELRDGNFTYRGQSTMAASETFGSLSVVGGHNVFNVTPNGAGGTATLTATGDLTLGGRATLQVSGTTLGAAGKVFVNGTLPAADSTGILPRMFGSADFLTYSPVTGLTAFTGYALDFSTPGTNVSVTAASTVASSVAINALKRAGTFMTTIGAGQTLTINSGMILNTSGTGTITGGTLNFGANPGIFLNGTNTVSSAVTGSDGLIIASGTTTLSGDNSGLSGLVSVHNGTLALSTNTLTAPIHVRAGTLNFNVSQTGPGLGAITLGVAANDANLMGLAPTFSFAGAGANAMIARDIIIDNGAQTAAGVELSFSTITRFAPLSNLTGSQTLSGNITLNSPLNLQGGGGGGTGSTNFTGNISGPALFQIPNGRASFSGDVSNAEGFLIGGTGFTAQITFTGTGSGPGPIRIIPGNNTSLSYANGSLSSGPITVQSGLSAVTLIPLDNSMIANAITLNGNAIANVGTGITAEWAGPLSGSRALTKQGAGALVLSNASSTYSGAIGVQAGTLRVDGSLPGASVRVFSTGTFGGNGSITGDTVVEAGGTISPGASVGSLSIGNLDLVGTLRAEVDLNGGGAPLADLLSITGAARIDTSTLDLPLSNLPIGDYAGGTFLIALNDGVDAIDGVFGAITGLPMGYSASVNYAFSGVDSLGRLGDGNDIAVSIIPAPAGVLAIGGVGAAGLIRRRRGA